MSGSLRIAVTLTGEALTAFRDLAAARRIDEAERTGRSVTTSEVVSEAIMVACQARMGAATQIARRWEKKS